MTAEFSIEQYARAAEAIQGRSKLRPTIGVILGSGLGGIIDSLRHATVIPYHEIPNFPTNTAPGHAGRLVLGRLSNAPVCVMQGRFHFYEGHSLQQVTFPVRVMQRMGVKTLIITNAAGGLNPALALGDIMLIEDHINLAGMTGANPLIGPNLDDFGPRFPATNHLYTARLRSMAFEVAAQKAVALRRGVYVWLTGPAYESPAEARMLRTLGADAVGMSTVPEALVAGHAGMEVLAFSMITNMVIDRLDAIGAPTAEEVLEAGALIVPRLVRLLQGIVVKLAAGP